MDVLPYAAHYHVFQGSLTTWLLLIVFRLSLRIYPDPTVDKGPAPPISGRRLYDHPGVSGILKECIKLYEETRDLAKQLEEFQFHNMSLLEQRWLALEQECRQLEHFMQDVKYRLLDINMWKRSKIKRGQLPSKEYENSERKMELEDMPRVMNWTKSVRNKIDVLYKEMLEIPFTSNSASILNLSSNWANLGNTTRKYLILTTLAERGIYLFVNPFQFPDDPIRFDIDTLQQLYKLFVELDSAYDEALRIPDIVIRRFPHSGKSWIPFIRRRPSLLYLPDLETVEGFEAMRLKYLDIPSYYRNNFESLVQFKTWMDAHIHGIRTSIIINIDEKCTRARSSLSGFIERIDEKLMQVKSLYDDMKG